jgi:hypothetical protein
MPDPPRRIAAAVAGAGVVLCVLGWYQISGQPTVPQQLPYLASATIPGAALLAVGLVLALRTPLTRGVARRSPVAAPGATASLWRVPDGRYAHTADCPLLDGRTDLIAVAEDVGRPDDSAAPPPCPLCGR